MKRLLRSCIDVDGQIRSEDLLTNFRKLRGSRLVWTREDDQKVYTYLDKYFQTRLAMPHVQALKDYFGASEDAECLERLGDICESPPYWGSGFVNLLENIQEEQLKAEAAVLFDQGKTILTRGLVIDKVEKKGLRDAYMHFTREASQKIMVSHGAKVRGNVRRDGKEEKKRYIEAKLNKDKGTGHLCGLLEIDRVVRGCKPGELWVHAAYTGELKSTFARNWLYFLVTRMGQNVVLFSLEMPYDQVRMLFYTLHTTHPKWIAQGYTPLAYERIQYGLLSPEEEAFYFKVVEDFNENPEYGNLFVECIDDMDMALEDIKLTSELIHQESKLSLICIDHGGLVDPPKKGGRQRDYVVEINSIMRGSKRLALGFNQGEKIAILLLMQINREGKDEASKNGGRYKLRAINYASEAERSADCITTSYLDESHREAGTTLFDNLKRRDGPLFPPSLVRVDFLTQRFYNMERFDGGGDGGISVDDHRSVMLDLGGILWPWCPGLKIGWRLSTAKSRSGMFWPGTGSTSRTPTRPSRYSALFTGKTTSHPAASTPQPPRNPPMSGASYATSNGMPSRCLPSLRASKLGRNPEKPLSPGSFSYLRRASG